MLQSQEKVVVAPWAPEGPRQRGCWVAVSVLVAILVARPIQSPAQTLEQQLSQPPEALAQAARESGDAGRGAILFHQQHLACMKCHAVGEGPSPFGPDLARLGKEATDAHLVESLLAPSKVIRKGFETVVVLTVDGRTITGLLVAEDKDRLELRDATQNFRRVTVATRDVERRALSAVSIMPAGQLNSLASRQEVLDLIRYLIEVRDGGPERAKELRPPPQLLVARPLPEYESRIDHAGMLRGLDRAAFQRGEAIYNRLCINCHGTHEQPGSLPTSLRFASGKFKSGSDPHAMYQTLTRGFGMMAPQTWMVPQQKYDVIHYVREAYLKGRNPSQHFALTEEYLAGLPKGDTRGPKPSSVAPWEQMDYGPNLVATYEIGSQGSNFAYKGNAVRLDAGPGGVSQGRHWMVFDHDTLRMAAGWSGQGFIDYEGINFNGRHGVHPRLVGRVQFANPSGPGWANPATGQLVDDARVVGRDGRRHGPLPRSWARYQGMYAHGPDTILAYTVGQTSVLEMPALDLSGDRPAFKRIFNVGPRDKEMILQVAQRDASRVLRQGTLGGTPRAGKARSFVLFGRKPPAKAAEPAPAKGIRFDGATHVEVVHPGDFDLRDRDFTIAAR